MVNESPVIELEKLTFKYPNGMAVFEDFCWQVQPGETWAVIGPSGCGKTTLLCLLAGLYLPNSGQVRIAGQVLRRPRPKSGLILQDYGLLPWATVRQNAALGLHLRTFYGPDGKHAPEEYQPTIDVDPWLERLGLIEIKDKYPSQISGGQRQRCAIARTLVLKPDLLLMDEPFASLDAPTRTNLQKLTMEIWSEQALTLVTVTHSIEEAALLGQKVLLLGHPPNRQAQVIEKPQEPSHTFSETQANNHLVQELRRRLDGSE
jgi:ABC-type nitrate/sulfonate/bicarbonate transport system ATPase subunit